MRPPQTVVGDRAQPLREQPEASRRHVHAAERIALVRVEAGRDQDELAA